MGKLLYTTIIFLSTLKNLEIDVSESIMNRFIVYVYYIETVLVGNHRSFAESLLQLILLPDWRNISDSCPRDWRLYWNIRGQLEGPPETPPTSQHYSIEGLNGGP